MNTLKTKKKIKLLIVEDSPTVSLCLERLFNSDPDIEVIGNLRNGKLAVEFIKKNKPDIITMDIDMPIMNGFDATRIIMSSTPVPIIVVTASRNARKHGISMEALAAGALTVVQKPQNICLDPESEESKKMVSTVKIYSEVKVIKRRPITKIELKPQKTQIKSKENLSISEHLHNKKILVIGISTGGPEVLKKLFCVISEKFPFPVLVVQHITDGFLESMVIWLNNSSKANVHIAKHNEILLPGNVYFAPNRFQMGIKANKIVLQKQDSDMKICPSVSHLFKSALLYSGKNTIAMLLTGMGKDGAKELKELKEAGALTIAQDKESSMVHGMPGKAIELKGAKYILNPTQIISILKNLEESLPIDFKINLL